MGPTGSTRIVQIHPTRQCNLSCKHCYSSSSPQATDSLAPDVVKKALNELAEQGYDWVTFSGGEPLVYEPLAEVLSHANNIGFKSTLVSNGMLLSGTRLKSIADKVSGLVISLDGKPESHNRMRNSPRAFELMQRNLEELRKRDMAFAFLFTLTQNNLDELPWVAEFCVQSGANGLFIHPLEITGNAVEQLPANSPDSLESAHAWALTEHLKTHYEGHLNIQLDLVHTTAFRSKPHHYFLDEYTVPLQGSLSDLMSVLVVEPDGEVVPLQYGFPRDFSLGNIHAEKISTMLGKWQNHLGPKLHQLCSDLYQSLEADRNPRFLNWYEQLDRLARQQCPVPVLPMKRGSMNIGPMKTARTETEPMNVSSDIQNLTVV